MALNRFVFDIRGGVAPLFALSLIPTMFSVGAAVDYTRASSARARMQGALDSALLMIAKESQTAAISNVKNAATAYFNANLGDGESIQNVQLSVPATFPSDGSPLKANASGTVKTTFLGAFGYSTVDIAVNSAIV